MNSKSVDFHSDPVYKKRKKEIPVRPAQAGGSAAEAMAIENSEVVVTTRPERRSLKLYFDDIVAGEPCQSVKDTELVIGAAEGDIACVREFVQNGADVHTENDHPLRIAASNGHTEIVEFLLQHGADAKADGNEALLNAARSGYVDVVTLLLNYGADVHARNDEALRLAKESCEQVPDPFSAQRPTPEGGHAKTIEILRARAASPA